MAYARMSRYSTVPKFKVRRKESEWCAAAAAVCGIGIIAR